MLVPRYLVDSEKSGGLRFIWFAMRDRYGTKRAASRQRPQRPGVRGVKKRRIPAVFLSDRLLFCARRKSIIISYTSSTYESQELYIWKF